MGRRTGVEGVTEDPLCGPQRLANRGALAPAAAAMRPARGARVPLTFHKGLASSSPELPGSCISDCSNRAYSHTTTSPCSHHVSLGKVQTVIKKPFKWLTSSMGVRLPRARLCLLGFEASSDRGPNHPRPIALASYLQLKPHKSISVTRSTIAEPQRLSWRVKATGHTPLQSLTSSALNSCQEPRQTTAPLLEVRLTEPPEVIGLVFQQTMPSEDVMSTACKGKTPAAKLTSPLRLAFRSTDFFLV